jgi:signal transduction histidine kinase
VTPDAQRAALHFPDLPKLELDELIDQLVDRAQGVKRAQGRLRALLRAIETVAGDLSLETVLRNVVGAACHLAEAQYGALGVISHDGGLEQFIHVGIDDELAARIGPLPQGKGLLGALITDPQPIRLEHMRDDLRSTGFPPHHPPMDSFLGVPIRVRGQVFGNLYLANSARGMFSDEDEELVLALALAAGTAISNARLYHDSRMQQRWLEASLQIGAQMVSPSGEDPLGMIARLAIEISDADLVSVGLVSADRKDLVVEIVYGEGEAELLGRRFELEHTVAGRVIASGTPLLSVDGSDTQTSHLATAMELGPMMVLPLQGSGEPRGALSLVRRRGRLPFNASDLAMAAGFATHASVALELDDSRQAEQRLVLLEDRDRIARDLHDHVIQELFAIGLGLEGVATQLTGDDQLAGRVRQRVDDIDRTIRRIRTSIFELRGAAAASSSLRQRILEVATDLTPALGFSPHVAFGGLVDISPDDAVTEDVIACVRESLTNVAKHARATDAAVDVALVGRELTVTVSDNGIGINDPTRSSGTANLRTRAERLGGSFDLAAAPAGGTIAIWKVTLP